VEAANERANVSHVENGSHMEFLEAFVQRGLLMGGRRSHIVMFKSVKKFD
jgi:hypothetical protein